MTHIIQRDIIFYINKYINSWKVLTLKIEKKYPPLIDDSWVQALNCYHFNFYFLILFIFLLFFKVVVLNQMI